MRLIDADNLEEAIKEYFKKHITDNSCMVDGVDCSAGICRLVKEQPTAFDVEKVIEKLQVLSDKADDDIAVCEADTCQYYDGYGDGLDKAIEIVKRGGRDEQINT